MRQFTGSRLVIATHNAGKLEEFRNLLNFNNISLISSGELRLPEPLETEESFVGNARLKAYAATRASGLPCLADDSGICVEALGGAPGVYTADWAETGSGRDFVKAMTRTWAELEAIKAPYPRRASFNCTLVLAWPDGHDAVFEGSLDGQVVWPMRGAEGHGYDPIFQPDGHELTLAEMGLVAKNLISHRTRAVQRLRLECFT